MTLDKKITLCENLTPVEVRIGNYIMNLEPLITEVTRFLGTGFFEAFLTKLSPQFLRFFLYIKKLVSITPTKIISLYFNTSQSIRF